jgi:hypothetical protein
MRLVGNGNKIKYMSGKIKNLTSLVFPKENQNTNKCVSFAIISENDHYFVDP